MSLRGGWIRLPRTQSGLCPGQLWTGSKTHDAAAQGRVAHFAVLMADGSKITLASVSFHGHSFAVGGLPAGHQPVAILAYTSTGQQIGSIKV
jgi:hypothetical protein